MCLPNADLLVAIRLIELDRSYNTKDEQFQISLYAVRTALTDATSSARQPNIDDFHAGSFSLASHLEFVTQTMLVDRSCILSVEKIFLLSGMLKRLLMLDKSDNPMIFANERRLHNCHTDANANASGDANGEKVPGGLTISLRVVLLDKIHAKYLKAISRLPMKDVRACYHRALVNGGYCYGPFSCVTNIIVNTLWYDSTFHAVEKLEVDMICTSTFVRVESRSLRGLIKLLLTCIPEISEHDAMIYLLKNNLKVRKAIEMAGVEGWESSWDVSAYKAAADASFHPELKAYVQFFTQSLPTVQSAVKSLLRASTPLSPNDVLQLAMLLPSSNCISAKSLETIVDLSTDALDMFIAYKEKFVTQQGFFRRKIEAALRKKGYLYDLQVICVANECVGSQKNFLDFKCPYSHVNFLASPKVGSGLKLFFAEFSNDDEDVSFCCTVSRKSKHEARCCYCEYEGTRIMHPAHPIEKVAEILMRNL
uniref:Uncharacterized protein n=1 Tax=Oryza punctata TaxID=4537 RepID=A0A0E0LFA7_ORYPU